MSIQGVCELCKIIIRGNRTQLSTDNIVVPYKKPSTTLLYLKKMCCHYSKIIITEFLYLIGHFRVKLGSTKLVETPYFGFLNIYLL